MANQIVLLVVEDALLVDTVTFGAEEDGTGNECFGCWAGG